MLSKNDLFPIGIGTWGIGGYAERGSQNKDKKQIEALAYMFSKGMNFFEVSLWAAEGWSAKLVAEAIKESGVKREDIFITEAIYTHNNPTLKSAGEECKRFLDIFETKYLDALEFSHAAFIDYDEDETIEFIQEKLDTKVTRFTSLTNAPLPFLKKYKDRFKNKFFAHEVGFNFEIRANEELGIIPYAQENGILTVVYQPLRRNRTAQRNWPLLVDLSNKYGVTQNQIIMRWIVSKGFLPLTKSETISHIDEHLDSLKLKLEAEDLKRLDSFTPPGYKPPKIDWERSGDGVTIDQLSNVFDEECEKQVREAGAK